MRTCTGSLVGSLIGVSIGLILAAGAVGCRSSARQTSQAAAGGGVGFQLPGAAHVAGGALVAEPNGREEAFLPFVASGVSGWVDACRTEAGGAAPLFAFRTDARGALRAVPPEAGPAETPRERCLAAQAVATAAAPGLPPSTRLVVRLALK